MPKGKADGTVLIGSSESATQKSIGDFIAARFSKNILGVSEASDLLLKIIDKEVDVAIIDTDLKGLPIAKTIQIVKKSRPRLPIIVVSDDYSVATGSRIMEQGIFYYMYKPLDMASLGEIVESALRKRAKEEA